MRTAAIALFALLTATMAAGCGSNDEPYKAAPAWSGRKPNVAQVPTLPNLSVKVADSYTIAGASHHLKSRYHAGEVTEKDISLTGYIVESNIPTAPSCAIHKTGKKDDDDCKSDIPTFWIADSKTEAKARVRVMGWAKNFATVYDAMEKYKGLKEAPKELVKDEIWQVDVPFPLPSVGAKVKVTGKYGYTFGKSSTGLVSDPQYGVMTYSKIEVLEPAPEPAAFKNKPGK